MVTRLLQRQVSAIRDFVAFKFFENFCVNALISIASWSLVLQLDPRMSTMDYMREHRRFIFSRFKPHYVYRDTDGEHCSACCFSVSWTWICFSSVRAAQAYGFSPFCSQTTTICFTLESVRWTTLTTSKSWILPQRKCTLGATYWTRPSTTCACPPTDGSWSRARRGQPRPFVCGRCLARSATKVIWFRSKILFLILVLSKFSNILLLNTEMGFESFEIEQNELYCILTCWGDAILCYKRLVSKLS